ncbi:ribosome maturation factor RimM [Arcanobacterium bovis]|uniref:Ribosome maturation factor RimM n=1 Tax=Arcanobacterium bovis TaxID=2529275 RepID=A0A4Q9V0S8_9ACTO|nr:ribosome maturation factor RimM [Arcanobacterium bovis]TBW20980.1 ribosome maturation factor RimM [Arcanobacterium bovis]
MKLIVAIIGAAHGLKGEVKLDVRTDSPQRRLYPGATLETEPADVGPLVVTKTREYKGMTFARFEEINDRTTAESLRGVQLVIETDEDDVEEDAWYAHELVGLEALDPEGYELGIVVGLQPMPAQDLLLVREPDGRVTQVPFVRDIVTEVDIDDHCVIIDAPQGLFSDDELGEEDEVLGTADEESETADE